MRAHSKQVIWSRLDPPGDSLGVSCDEDGPSIGPVRLLKRTAQGLEPRFSRELDFILGSALDRPVRFAKKAGALNAVAAALEKGDLARAMLITQFMWLPSLPDEQAFQKAVKADCLAKAGFNPDQSRDEQGRWTDGGGSEGPDASGFIPVQEFVFPETVIPWLEGVRPVDPLAPTPPFPGEILPPAVGAPGIAVPRTLDNPYPDDADCAQEWDSAREYCRDLADSGKLGVEPNRGQGRYYEQCVRGRVSDRCGGSPIDRTPRGPKRPYGGRSSYSPVV